MNIRYVYLFLIMSMIVSCRGGDTVSQEYKLEVLPDSCVDYKVLSIEEIESEQVANIIASSLSGGNEDIEQAIRKSFQYRYFVSADSAGCSVNAAIPYAFKKITYAYKSTDQHGAPVMLSAVVCWERCLTDKWHDVSPNGIALVNHFTITSDAECPSRGFPAEAFLFPRMLTVLPDYIGYGISKERQHPYLNHEVCAVNSIDALEAAKRIFEENSDTMFKEGWGTYSFGASQGAGNAIAVHKYMDTHNDVAQKWNFTYSDCAAGPYSPLLTMSEYISNDTTIYPVVLPMTLKSMLDSYPQTMQRWKEEDFYTTEYLRIKATVDSMLLSKDYTTAEINKIIFEHFGGEGATMVRICDILNERALDAESEMTKALYECFQRNDLTKGWSPKHPIYLYHSPCDRVVPCANADALLSSMGTELVTLNKSRQDEGHTESCVKWMLTQLKKNNK